MKRRDIHVQLGTGTRNSVELTMRVALRVIKGTGDVTRTVAT